MLCDAASLFVLQRIGEILRPPLVRELFPAIVRKEGDGARVHKTCSAPATSHQRLVAEARTPDAVRARVNEIYAGLDPVALLRDIRAVQEQSANLTDAAPASHPTAMPPIEQFLSSLRIAWKHGAGRPTDRPIAKPKRERRRPDPLVKAAPQLREWFEAEPWRTSELLLWRSEQASALVFGSGDRGTKRRNRHIAGKPAAAG